jgi:hypothetical protein
LVPACLLLAALGALAGGLATSGGEPQAQTAVPRGEAARAARRSDRAAQLEATKTTAAAAPKPLSASSPPLKRTTALPPSGKRLQDYSASMRLRLEDVDGLSDATVKALRIARGLGGYIVSVNYGSSARERGEAYVTVRVPVERVQQAIVRFSSLGTILAQNIDIQDVQPRVDALERRIVELRSQIAAIDARLKAPDLDPGERARLQFQRQRLATSLNAAIKSRTGTIRHARFATVSLNFTTAKTEKKAAPPGRFERTIDDAGGILLAEAAWTLLVLAVALPFVVLLVLALWGLRAARRFGDRRLLETS